MSRRGSHRKRVAKAEAVDPVNALASIRAIAAILETVPERGSLDYIMAIDDAADRIKSIISKHT